MTGPGGAAPRRGGRAPTPERAPFLCPDSELPEPALGAADLEIARRLDVELLDHAVVDDHRVALGALAHAVARAVHRQPEGFGELAVAVGEHGDVGRARGLVPGTEHERVVDRGADDL